MSWVAERIADIAELLVLEHEIAGLADRAEDPALVGADPAAGLAARGRRGGRGLAAHAHLQMRHHPEDAAHADADRELVEPQRLARFHQQQRAALFVRRLA